MAEVDDDTSNETVTVSHSVSGYGSVTANSVTVSVTDHDTAGVMVDPTSVDLTEGGTLSYSVTLVTQPTGNVTITPSSSDSGAVSVEPASITFTVSNWDTPQTVSVTAVDDPDTANETVTVSHSVNGYGSISANSVTVSVTDHDTAGVMVDPTSVDLTEGGTLSYSVTLVTQPSVNVTITPSSSDSGAVSVEPASLTFTAANWDTPRTVSVMAEVDDDISNETVTVSHSVSGYTTVTSADVVTVTMTDDDIVGMTVTDNTADTTAPTVTSITRQAPTTSPTNADRLTWRVTFSEAVTNVDAAAFIVSGSTATVTSVQAVNGETLAHDVTVSGGDLDGLNGTVMLGFASDENIQDQAGNPLATTRPTGANHNSYEVVATSMGTAEPLLTAWLSHMGRTVAQQVVDAVVNRGQADPAPGLQLSVAGEPLNADLSSLADNHGLLAKVLGFERVTSQQLAEGTGFVLSPTGGDGGGFSFWGKVALSNFTAAAHDHDFSMGGDLFTTLVGVDWRSEPWQVGAALAHSTGSGAYHARHGAAHGAGAMKSHLTGLYPYVHYGLDPQLSFWGVAGHGKGEWTLAPDAGGQQEMPLTLSLAAVGMERLVRDGGTEALTLKGNVDVLWVRTNSNAATGNEGQGKNRLDAVAAEASRLRLGLQATRTFPMGDGTAVTPSLEIGLRQDGGDGETGFGLDTGAGLLWQDRRHGLSGELKGRALLSHGAEGFQDRGFAASLSWDPDPSSERGASFSLSQTMGSAASGGVEALLSPVTMPVTMEDMGNGHGSNGRQQFEARLAYGLPVFNDRLTLSPLVVLSLEPSCCATTIGWSLSPEEATDPWRLSMEVQRQESSSLQAMADHELDIRFSLPF